MNDTRTTIGQASHILRSHLKSLEIPFMWNSDKNEIVIKGRTGTEIVVAVSEGKVKSGIPTNTVIVDAEDMISSDMRRILFALHSVTERAGHGKPVPVDRGQAPNKRINHHDDYELVILRHQVLRRTPTPSDMKEVESHLPVIKRCAQKTLFTFGNVLTPMGFDLPDLINLGRIYTMCFLHNYAYDLDTDGRIKLLTKNLNQRFGELAKVTYKKALSSSCLPQHIKKPARMENENGEDFDYISNMVADEEATEADEEYADGEYTLNDENGNTIRLTVENDGFLGVNLYINNRLLTSSEVESLKNKISLGIYTLVPTPMSQQEESKEISNTNSRRAEAKKALYKGLEAMSPENREAVLAYAALSRDYAPDARAVAKKICGELACPKCNKKVSIGIHCSKCGIEAKPRYGVNYIEYREQLKSDGDSFADGMTAPVADAQKPKKAGRGRPKKETATPSPENKLSKAEIDTMVAKMREECFNKLPELIKCAGPCGQMKHKSEFGIRVPRNKNTGAPERALRQSRCTPCRKSA